MEAQSEPVAVVCEACNGKGHRSIICTSQSRLRNIVTLPAEILSEICQLACDDAYDFKTRSLESFQLICRRFRSIAIGTFQVWSCVDDHMPLERMDLQFCRSGLVGMSFRIAFDGRSMPRSCKCPQWKLMKRHHSRWIRGYVNLSNLDEEKGHFCSDTLMDMHFPSLISLSLDFSDSGYEVNQFNWNMPRLESLHCKSDWDVLLPFTAPLKNFTMAVESGTVIYDDKWVLDFLASPSAASITTMTLDFSQTGNLEGNVLPDDDFRAQLCNLQTLHADFGHADNESEAVGFFGYLDTPNVKMLQLRVNDKIARGEHLWRWLERLTQDARRSLESVSVAFVIHDDGPEDRVVLRQRVLDIFPSHQHVVDMDRGSQSPGKDVVSHGLILNVAFEDNRPDEDADVSIVVDA